MYDEHNKDIVTKYNRRAKTCSK